MSTHKKAPAGPRINEMIDDAEIRFVGEDGEMLGVISLQEALAKAAKAGLDLVEVSPGAKPPVCKLMDYGKQRYAAQKKAKEARKKQKVIHIKEIKLRPNIDPHDYGIKVNAARRFIEAGDKVKVTLRFRGREMSHQELGMDLLKKMQQELADVTKVESDPSFEGRQIHMVLAPMK